MELRNLINILEAIGDQKAKIDRSAFIYLDPTGKKEEFAQCGTCIHFMPGKKRCNIYSKDDKVVANASCGLYVQGKPNDDQEFLNVVTPKESGYVLGQVRCENCDHFDGKKTCVLFEKLNESLPELFKLNTTVEPLGCCNAQQNSEA
jgi:hypothetical protein